MNPENIIPHQYQPGESGNPNGRRAGTKNRSTILKEILALIDKESGKSNEYLMNNAIIKKAIKGDVAAFKEIQDSLHGKIPDKALVAETTPEGLDVDVTKEVFKDIPTERLESIANTTLPIEDKPENAQNTDETST